MYSFTALSTQVQEDTVNRQTYPNHHSPSTFNTSLGSCSPLEKGTTVLKENCILFFISLWINTPTTETKKIANLIHVCLFCYQAILLVMN